MLTETLLYELVNGSRLELKDVFAENADFLNILNVAIDNYIMKNNLEEQILKSPFKGIREGQDYDLSEDSLRIFLFKNEEISTMTMMFMPNFFSFKLNSFNGMVDIYDKYSAADKQIYKSNVIKKKMLANDFEYKFMHVDNKRENYRSYVNGYTFSGMKNKEVENLLNSMFSDAREDEFIKLFPANMEKTDKLDKMPYKFMNYSIIGNYCDLISIECIENYWLPEATSASSQWHVNYNVLTGKKLELKDFFKEQYDWKKAVISFINDEMSKNGRSPEDNMEKLISGADYWFDEENLRLILNPEIQPSNTKQNNSVFSIPFEYLGDENMTMRE